MITDTELKALTDALRGGSDVETASHFAGLSAQQVLKWLELGKLEKERRSAGLKARPSEDAYVAFWENLKKARADAIVRNVTNIQKAAADGSWQAAAWWLERTVPETYGKRAAKPVQTASRKQVEASES